MELLHASPAAWTAAGTWATAVVLGVTLWFVHRQVREAAELRRQQTRPYVIPAIDIEQQMMAMLTLENVGTTAAHNVRLEFDQMPRSRIKEIEDVHFVTETTPTLPPGRAFRAYWDSMTDILDDDYAGPRRYDVRVHYEDQNGRQYGPEAYVLDFEVFRGQAVGPKGLPELVKAVEQLKTEHAKWTQNGNSLLVRGLSHRKENRSARRSLDRRRFRQVRHQSGLKAALRSWVDQRRQRTRR